MTLLHVDLSILGSHSVSRLLSAEIVDRQRRLHPGIEVIYRDLAADPLMHLSPAHIAAFQGAAPTDSAVQADIVSGGKVLDELFAASIIVIGAPMYNFGISSQLKAWIDRLVVAGRTFHYTEKGAPESLLPKGKKAIIASSRGGAYGRDFTGGLSRPPGKLSESGIGIYRRHGRDHHPRREYRQRRRCAERRSRPCAP